MYTREDICGFFRMALELGLISKDVAIHWVDEEIHACEVPDPQSVELSLAAHQPVDAVIDALRPMARTLTPPAFRILGAVLHRRMSSGSLNEAQVANLFYIISTRFDGAEQVFGADVYRVDEWFEPWMMDPDAAALALREFLQSFACVPLPPVVEAHLP